ncbi:NAD-dependent epimerase/dehydratase family protein [bacterium]|nr:NAD-dependent epimerase/dehydratase family protein [bacterium]
MKKALITGANGFIGRHLITSLKASGYNITAIIRDRKDIPPEWDDNVKVHVGDITDKASIEGISDNVDVVFHLASYVHKTPKSQEEIRLVNRVNIDGTKNLLESLGPSIKHIIFFSSVSVYGTDSGLNIDETFETNPITPYGITKLKAEVMIRDWGKDKGVITTILRLPMVYGPGNKGNIYTLIEGVDKGRFVMMGNGENKRSFAYVGNAIDAAVAVAGHEETDFKVYIVTDGIDYTVKELYELIAKGLGKRPLPFYVPMSIAKVLAHAGDTSGHIIGKTLPFNSGVLNKLTSSLTFSSRKIREEIGFKPKYDLYNTMNETIESYRRSKSEI